MSTMFVKRIVKSKTTAVFAHLNDTMGVTISGLKVLHLNLQSVAFLVLGVCLEIFLRSLFFTSQK